MVPSTVASVLVDSELLELVLSFFSQATNPKVMAAASIGIIVYFMMLQWFLVAAEYRTSLARCLIAGN